MDIIHAIRFRKGEFVKVKCYLCILLSFLLFSCSTRVEKDVEHVLNEAPLWQGKKEIVAGKIQHLGSDDFNKSDDMFGFVSDIALDRRDNIYILDYMNNKVSKFSPEGEFQLAFGEGKGQVI